MSKKSEKKQKDKGIKVISSPLNFQHRVHVGADRVDIQELQALFETAGKTGNTQLQTPPAAPEVSKQGLSNNNVGGSNTPLVFTPPPPCPNGDISGEGKVGNHVPLDRSHTFCMMYITCKNDANIILNCLVPQKKSFFGQHFPYILLHSMTADSKTGESGQLCKCVQ